MKLGILSGHYPGVRFNSQINHKCYADCHGYHSIFNGSPERDRRRYFSKIETILRYLALFDWIFWIDDDAYFTDFRIPLTRFIDTAPTAEFVICKSPSTKTLFTKFSSGQFFLKNTPRAHDFLRAVLAVDLAVVKAAWRDELGYFTRGDQDAMVHLVETEPRFAGEFCRILDHDCFNNRDFEYLHAIDEHFLVHFTGRTKRQSMQEFVERLGTNRFLTPAPWLAELRIDEADEPV
ncbi:MAG: hypothetical protein WD060_11845 [Pirellulales bacterium]